MPCRASCPHDCCCCCVSSVVSDSVRPHRRQPTRLPCPWDSPGKNTRVGCHFLLQCMKVKSESEVAQSCLTLCERMDCSTPGFPVLHYLPEFAKTQRRRWDPTPILLPRKAHGWRSLVGCSPWGRKESDTTEQLHFHFSLPCIGEGNGNPPQCSCLENPRDGGAWWAAVYGVTQSRTRLKRLSSSSSTFQMF